MARKNREIFITVFAYSIYWFDIVYLRVMVAKKLVCFPNTLRTVDAVLVGRVILELRAAPLTRRLLLCTLPVPVVLAGVWITVLAVRLPGFRIVELDTTPLA
jgi:hypothetical protein